ncbi:MAG: hypothetical protein ABIH64_05210 [Nanoarchaeota archaeon]
MKHKSLAGAREFKELRKKIAEARKDPEFMHMIDEFIAYHTGKSS